MFGGKEKSSYLCTRNRKGCSRKILRCQCCGNSSVGRAQPCQGWGREFESRFPLKIKSNSFGLLFSFCMVTKIRPKRPQTPLPGAGGVNTTREKLPTSIVGSSLVFRNPVQARPTISVWRAILSYRKSLLHNNYQPIEIIANFVISF